MTEAVIGLKFQLTGFLIARCSGPVISVTTYDCLFHDNEWNLEQCEDAGNTADAKDKDQADPLI